MITYKKANHLGGILVIIISLFLDINTLYSYPNLRVPMIGCKKNSKNINYGSKKYIEFNDKVSNLIEKAWHELGECNYTRALYIAKEALGIVESEGIFLTYEQKERLKDIITLCKTILDKGLLIDPQSYIQIMVKEERPMLLRAVAFLNCFILNTSAPTAEELEKEALKWNSVLAEFSALGGVYYNEQRKRAMQSYLYKWQNDLDYRKKRNDDPIAFASEVYTTIVSLHPYKDGNHRTANLLMNFFLVASGYKPFSLTDDSLVKSWLGKLTFTNFEDYLRSNI